MGYVVKYPERSAEKAEAPVYVDFEGFTARIYTIDGRSDVSAKADSVHVVTADLLEID